MDRILKWINLCLKQPRVKASRKKDPSSEPTSSTETRHYKPLKKIVTATEATTVEPTQAEEVLVKQVTEALEKAKVNYQDVVAGVISSFDATHITTMYLGEQAFEEGPSTVPMQIRILLSPYH